MTRAMRSSWIPLLAAVALAGSGLWMILQGGASWEPGAREGALSSSYASMMGGQGDGTMMGAQGYSTTMRGQGHGTMMGAQGHATMMRGQGHGTMMGGQGHGTMMGG